MHKLHSVCLHYDPPVSPVTSPSRDAINLVNESISLPKNTAGREERSAKPVVGRSQSWPTRRRFALPAAVRLLRSPFSAFELGDAVHCPGCCVCLSRGRQANKSKGSPS